jgi:predicted nucleic acid-binding protein
MSDLLLKREIRKVIRESGFKKNSKMACSIIRVLNMKHKNIDKNKAYKIASEILA